MIPVRIKCYVPGQSNVQSITIIWCCIPSRRVSRSRIKGMEAGVSLLTTKLTDLLEESVLFILTTVTTSLKPWFPKKERFLSVGTTRVFTEP